MLLDPAVINAVFQGLVVLVGAVASLLAVRGRRVEVARRDYRRTRTRLQVALAYIDRLADRLAAHGHPIPRRPAELDEDDEPAPSTGGGPDARA